MAKAKKENEFDPRRETLVMERKTTWPADLAVTEQQRKKISDALHQYPEQAKKLEYLRTATGLIRHVTVTPEDVQRVSEQ